MSRRVALVRTDVSEESFASLIRVTRISELRTLAELRLLLTVNVVPQLADFCHPDDGGVMFLGNVGPYNSHSALTSQKTTFFIGTAVKT
jgi:hypothetical protein